MSQINMKKSRRQGPCYLQSSSVPFSVAFHIIVMNSENAELLLHKSAKTNKFIKLLSTQKFDQFSRPFASIDQFFPALRLQVVWLGFGIFFQLPIGNLYSSSGPSQTIQDLPP